ncbi:hypothetical protein AGMMS49983_18160 [Clostridia bacterium]|nr:hypothetical protein AGMMS49983_18160 [Clostridia bacterium]
MKLATVVGNVVSTIKDKDYHGYKLMIVQFMDEKGVPKGPRQIVFDAAQSGIGDVVLVNIDGGAANMLLNDGVIIADYTICGILDHISYDGHVTEYLKNR